MRKILSLVLFPVFSSLLLCDIVWSSSLIDPHIVMMEKVDAVKRQRPEAPKWVGQEREGLGKSVGSAAGNQNQPGENREEQTEKIIGVFIKTSRLDILKAFIHEKSGKINSVIGSIVTAQIPLSAVSELGRLSGVEYVELAKPVHSRLNKSLPLTGAPAVHNGVNGGGRYTGNGVLIGIVDSGIDWKHSTFRGNDGTTRVLALWDQRLSPRDGFIGPKEFAQPYGLECKKLDFDLDRDSLCPSKDVIGHGTHVAGIVAGSDNRYKGMAPSAQIIAVALPFEEGETDFTPNVEDAVSETNYVVDGVNYIFQKAQRLGRPAVVNLSLGTHFGPHDSSSLFEEALNELVRAAPGRAIVASAGNEAHLSDGYLASVHAGFPLNGEKRAVEFTSGDPSLHGIIIDIWQPQISNLSFGVGVDNYASHYKTGMVAPDGAGEFQSGEGRLNIFIDSSETDNPLNDKKHSVIYIVAAGGNNGVSVAHSKYTFDLMVEGVGEFDAWIASGGFFSKRTGYYERTGLTYAAGDSQHTVSIPATASEVLSVASTVSRNDFKDEFLRGPLPEIGSLVVGDVSKFSSLGPTVSPDRTGQKPEITAPGEWIISAMSSHASEKFDTLGVPTSMYFVLLSGTSMAAPHVAGAVAFLFEKNPALPATDAKRILIQATGQNLSEAQNPDNRRGYGHLNVARAVQLFDQDPLGGALSISATLIPEIPFSSASSMESLGEISTLLGVQFLKEGDSKSEIFVESD